jgi:hypothetical protein
MFSYDEKYGCAFAWMGWRWRWRWSSWIGGDARGAALSPALALIHRFPVAAPRGALHPPKVGAGRVGFWNRRLEKQRRLAWTPETSPFGAMCEKKIPKMYDRDGLQLET